MGSAARPAITRRPMNVAAKDKMYMEAHRVLKPGRIFAVYDVLQAKAAKSCTRSLGHATLRSDSEYRFTRISRIHKGLRGCRPRWPRAMPGLAPIPTAGRRGPHRSAFPSPSDAASRSPTPPVEARL